MGQTQASIVRRTIAVAATLGVAASLTAAMTTGAGATDEQRDDERAAPELLVRQAPANGGTFVVRGRAARESASRPSPAEMDDLRTFARTSGEPLAELVASHRGLDELGSFFADYESRNPGRYVAGGLASPQDGDLAWVQLTKRPTAAERARMQRLPVDLRVTWGLPASSAEIARLSERLVDQVADAGVVESAQAGYDHRAQVMRLTYDAAEEAPAARVSASVTSALRSVQRESVGSALPLEVVTERVDADLAQEQSVVGGANLNVGRTNAACTGGFTVVRRGQPGVLTAGHCPNKMTYGTRNGIIAKQVATPSAKKFDLQFHRTMRGNGHSTSRKFKATASGPRSVRPVRKVVNAPRGSTVCHWGRTSGYSCARVRVTNICVRFEGDGKACGIDATRRYISAPGDSGGPWFYGNTARGIHTGGGGNSSFFTRIGKSSTLGARVMSK